MSVDISQKAESIIERMTLIFDDKARLGVINHKQNLEALTVSTESTSCKSCLGELTPLERYWYIDTCESCERSSFLENEFQKLSPIDATKVRSYVLFKMSSCASTKLIN
ncbi:hypothetical protein ACXHQ0_18935 [Vibrio antiquarius]|uniref:Uncharacterized protein n=1 Tax=Vibrio parahaemolyticus TaxID=670 RepID=A0AA46UR04_VIBPH|nr:MULTISPECIES: hypothetical protein [Vibrio harveyi group]MCS0313600.1 hypothetical protein [Vibrio diabolicus]UYV30313.1 hypothetical protein M5598_25225 [Vibrio parahaemolyticus]